MSKAAWPDNIPRHLNTCSSQLADTVTDMFNISSSQESERPPASRQLSLSLYLKAGTHWPRRWTSETFGCWAVWKLLEPRRRCLVRFTLQSQRVLGVGGLDTIGYSDWLSAICSITILIDCVGGAEVTMVCTPFRSCFHVLDSWHETSATRC